MGEEEAFNMLKFLMFEMGLRKQYRPDMIILQVESVPMYLLETNAKNVYDPFPGLSKELSPPSVNTGVAVLAEHLTLGWA